MKKFFIGFMWINLFICISSFTGCTSNEIITNNLETNTGQERISADESNLEIYETDLGDTVDVSGDNIDNKAETSKLIAEEVGKLQTKSGIDGTAILVNGQSITKKEIEIQKIYAKYLNSITIKDRIVSIIKDKVVKSEAIKLKIKPSQESIDAYLKQTDIMLENKVAGTEITFAYMEGLGVTKKEYLSMLEETAYDMYQREALWTLVEQTQKYKNYEEYVDFLLKRADIQVLDEEAKKILR